MWSALRIRSHSHELAGRAGSLNWGPRYIRAVWTTHVHRGERLSCTDKIYQDGKVHDVERIDFLARYLEKLSGHSGQCRRAVLPLGLLNLRSDDGYGSVFGLVYVDYASGMLRTVPSGMRKSRGDQ